VKIYKISHVDDYLIEKIANYWKKVNSSIIDAIGYSDFSKKMEVKLKNGKIVPFFDIDEKTYNTLIEKDEYNSLILFCLYAKEEQVNKLLK
jgi:hypothetical protein